ncbi:murein biosynthesis integral membrane protein MurJ [Paenibacillus hamazuiensis]|uniref:murein biosynthesis integral membrane protein MurJ n=1 Tax=Paenibacillus hamazuiensis TaxID=2936508 RepID=UPI00200E7440|nr:lipid II flippase MurJ [Paenibacillus hamazuiensis]
MRRRLLELATNSVLLITAINALGAVLAFVRDVVMAMYLGTSVHADAFTLAYFVPDTLGNNIIGTAIGTVCVPAFAKLYASRLRKTFNSSVMRTAGIMFGGSVLLWIGCMALTKQISVWLGGGTGLLAQTVHPLLLIVLPIMALYPAALVGAGAHQSLQRFIVPVTAPILVNAAILAAVWAALLFKVPQSAGASYAAWGVVAGTTAMSVWIWLPLLKVFRRHADDSPDAEGKAERDERKLWQSFAFYAFILLAAQAVGVAERYLAARTETGAVAALNFAYRLAQFPVWVYVSAFGVVMLPKLAQQLAHGRTGELQTTIVRALSSVLFVAIPVSALLWLLREPIVSLLFERGAFDSASVELTSGILEGYALAIVFQSISVIALRYFLAVESLTLSAAMTVLSTAATIGLDFAFSSRFGVRGLGFGAAVGAFISAAGFAAALHRQVNIRAAVQPALLMISLNIPAALSVVGLAAFVKRTAWESSFVHNLLFLTAAVALYSTILLVLSLKFNLFNRLWGEIQWQKP